MTLKGGSSHACAACKFQRRKCSSECLLAQFFPSENPKLFHNAHKLFGVRNIVKIIKPLNNFQRLEAMTSIIFESNVREEFPVHGCYGVIRRLESQICLAEEELNSLQAKLAFFRQNQNDSLSQLQLGMVNLGLPDNEIPKLPFETDQVYPIDFSSEYPCLPNQSSKFLIDIKPFTSTQQKVVMKTMSFSIRYRSRS